MLSREEFGFVSLDLIPNLSRYFGLSNAWQVLVILLLMFAILMKPGIFPLLCVVVN